VPARRGQHLPFDGSLFRFRRPGRLQRLVSGMRARHSAGRKLLMLVRGCAQAHIGYTGYCPIAMREGGWLLKLVAYGRWLSITCKWVVITPP